MKMQSNNKRRATRVRATLKQGGNKLRLSVFRSNAHIWAQIIDDSKHVTIAAANDIGLNGTKTDKAKAVGAKIAEAAKKIKITNIVFDRGSYRYHGRIRALAIAAREGGLKF
ncbi:MAG: 50S ribosomal protein L18 [Candidatus Microgenomates bacterium]